MGPKVHTMKRVGFGAGNERADASAPLTRQVLIKVDIGRGSVDPSDAFVITLDDKST